MGWCWWALAVQSGCPAATGSSLTLGGHRAFCESGCVSSGPGARRPAVLCSPQTSPVLGQVHMLRKAKQKPKKSGTPKDVRAEGTPAPEGDSK